MNQQQKKYAMERLATIRKRRETELTQKYTTPESIHTPSERAAMFKRGEFTVNKSVKRITNYTDLTDVVQFKGERPATVNQPALDKAKAALFKEYHKACDELMLGDETKALALIKSFDK